MGVKDIAFIIVIVTFSMIVLMFNINLSTYESFELSLLMLGLLTTFGGAYIGASIAGKYALKVSKDQRDYDISVYRKKASYLRTIYYDKAIKEIKSMRVSDLGKPKKVYIDEKNQILIGGTFREKEYTPMDSYTLDKISKIINGLNEFRLSDGYYHLSENEIKEMDYLVDKLEEVVDGFVQLNYLSCKDKDENDEEFKKIKEDTFDALDIVYGLE